MDAVSLLEIHPRWAKELIVGYARQTVDAHPCGLS
jgi:acetyl-CoA carboxylase carboxyltransferase component